MKTRLLAAGAIGVTAAIIVLALGAAGLLGTAELKTYDWRMRLAADPSSVDRNIVLVELNDTTIRDMAPIFGQWPWPRVALSTLIDYLHRAPARVVAVDIAFLEPDTHSSIALGGETWTGKESDAALATSVKTSGNVILLADAVNEGVVNGTMANGGPPWTAPAYRLGPPIEHRPLVTAPFEPLNTVAAALGHNYLRFDPDGPARRMTPFIENGGRYLPSLGVAAALLAGGIAPADVRLDGRTLRAGDRRIPLVPLRVRDRGKARDEWAMMVNYRAPALVNGRSPYPSYEMRHLLYSEQQLLAGQKPQVDPSVFKDKIVFVGFTASGLMDSFATPFGDQGSMPGIQLHASVADSILSGRFIVPGAAPVRLATVFGLALAIGSLTLLLPLAPAVGASSVVLAAWTWLTVVLFRGGAWWNLVQPLAAGGLALFGGVAYQYFVEGREKRIVKRLFGRYVSRDVYAHLLAHPEAAELGGGRRDMTVLFSDIRGFTTVTERGEPEAIVAQLNEYFSKMVEVVFRHGGTLDKFVGDMVMALFGAPLDDADHAEHAVAAALDMVAELAVLNHAWAAAGKAQLDIGIGVNSGDMIAGNIGSSSVMSYTVIGDNVNLGSRLESLNKEYKTRIIISDATRTRLAREYDLRPLGDVVVKGKSVPVAIYEVRVPSPLGTSEELTT